MMNLYAIALFSLHLVAVDGLDCGLLTHVQPKHDVPTAGTCLLQYLYIILLTFMLANIQ